MRETEETFEKKKRELLEDILYTSTSWETKDENVYSGCRFSMPMGKERVCGMMEFNSYYIDVWMTSPVEIYAHKYVYNRRPTFLNLRLPLGCLTVDGTENGPATEKCKRTAVQMMNGLYEDWQGLLARKEIIQEKLERFNEAKDAFKRSEQERIGSVKEKIKNLSPLCGEWKKKYKAGEISEKEYLSGRQPLHEQLSELNKQTHSPNFLLIYFNDEISSCTTLHDSTIILDLIFNKIGKSNKNA